MKSSCKGCLGTAPTLQRFTIRPAALDKRTMIIAPDDDGEYVTHADAIAAIEQAIEAAHEEERARLSAFEAWLWSQPEEMRTRGEITARLRSMGVL